MVNEYNLAPPQLGKLRNSVESISGREESAVAGAVWASRFYCARTEEAA